MQSGKKKTYKNNRKDQKNFDVNCIPYLIKEITFDWVKFFHQWRHQRTMYKKLRKRNLSNSCPKSRQIMFAEKFTNSWWQLTTTLLRSCHSLGHTRTTFTQRGSKQIRIYRENSFTVVQLFGNKFITQQESIDYILFKSCSTLSTRILRYIRDDHTKDTQEIRNILSIWFLKKTIGVMT